MQTSASPSLLPFLGFPLFPLFLFFFLCTFFCYPLLPFIAFLPLSNISFPRFLPPLLLLRCPNFSSSFNPPIYFPFYFSSFPLPPCIFLSPGFLILFSSSLLPSSSFYSDSSSSNLFFFLTPCFLIFLLLFFLFPHVFTSLVPIFPVKIV